MASSRILIVDDEDNIRKSIRAILEDEGYFVQEASSGAEGMEILSRQEMDLVISDVWMEELDGLQLLDFIVQESIDIEVIMISGHATIEMAVSATKKGAIDFLEKPLSFDKLILSITNALKHRALKIKNKWLLQEYARDNRLIGESSEFMKLKQDIELAAPTDGRVLLRGENGVGKEVVAKTLHLKSRRSDMPLVDVNCAAIPEELIESELFGHIKGAFTGATENKKGKFVLADGGTLFLDEIGDMSLKTQAKVLRALQENAVMPVGGSDSIKVDVRVISATNKNLIEEIEKGHFRQDLYYRLNVVELLVPPLRDRVEDIPILVSHFIDTFSEDKKLNKKEISREAMHMLRNYKWPGNVRELENLVERLMIMVRGDTITEEDIPFPVNQKSDEADSVNVTLLKDAREMFEKKHISRIIKVADGNMTRAAEMLGIERSYLYQKLKNFGTNPSRG